MLILLAVNERYYYININMRVANVSTSSACCDIAITLADTNQTGVLPVFQFSSNLPCA